MALVYNTYTAATYLAAMDAQDTAKGQPVGTTRKKIFNMEGMASVQAGLRTWTDKLVKDIVNNLPAEQYLDQTKTTMIPSFDWATMGSDYPGASDPGLDGKPVLVFAVVGKPVKSDSTAPDSVVPDTVTTTYSFLSLEDLIDVYSADNTTTKGVDITVSGNKISAELKLHKTNSSEADNAATLEVDGLYVPVVDTTEIEDRLDDLETIVGKEADLILSTPATGLVKKVADITEEIGVKAKAETAPGVGDAVAATGIYKYVDDALSEVQGGLNYATTADIDAIFA